MLKSKLLVLVLFIAYIYGCRRKYCDICPDHTLCKYEVSGPSERCVGYDENTLLTENDIATILDKINERRNFIAMGHSKFLPSAANMKKIVWSEELATFAQRWVDQCDQSLRPDKTDKCRDLANLQVGQNVATITGSTSSTRINVKSFVEIWFMKSIHYKGSVTYYNQSRDHKTNYFTQLIWADTDRVGCGMAKFFVLNAKPILVQRLVCNFSPSGNIHGKPVYTIGFAATQCNNGRYPDSAYLGLCSQQVNPTGDINVKLQSSNPPPTSFLRIRNLFINDSAKQEIDPVFSNEKQKENDLNDIGDNVYQKPLEVLTITNDSYDAVKRSYPYKNENLWHSLQSNYSRNYGEYLQKREKGHSRVYHGHDHKNEFDSLHPDTSIQSARRYDYATTALNVYMQQDYRKHNIDQQCTRKTDKIINTNDATECFPCKQKFNKCTRGLKYNQQINNCQMITHKCDFQTTSNANSYESCVCNSCATNYARIPNRCMQNTNCDCVSRNCQTTPCPHMRRTLRDISDEKIKKQSDFYYYDILSSSGVLSKNLKNTPILDKFILENNPWSGQNKHFPHFDRRKHLKRNYSERKRRVVEEDDNYKPFWQMDEYVNRNQPKLKSLRYTTLSNRKKLQYKRTRKSTKTPIKTETITIIYKERDKSGKRITEKYLSFEELMHLRKNNADDLSGRRHLDNKEILRQSNTSQQVTTAAVTTATTLEYTFNTPYIRMKYCTRKLTCTWTAASPTDSAGSIIPGGGAGAVGGSRTPPGYVEGCTRTSTCTRDYMNRNKMATLPIETTSTDPEPGDDEDYCERRSLNRRSNDNLTSQNQSDIILTKSVVENRSFLKPVNANSSLRALNHCICFRDSQKDKSYNYNFNKYRNSSSFRYVKRESKNSFVRENNLLSYDDLYYYVVKKIIEIWKSEKKYYPYHKCFCNGVNVSYSNLFLYFTIFLNYCFNCII